MREAEREQRAPNFASPTRKLCRFLTIVLTPLAWRWSLFSFLTRRKPRELARVVRPGGIAATYMWEFPDGFPLAPLAATMKDLGHTPPERPNVEASARDAMRAIWKQAGFTAVETEVIRIRVNFSSFDDFWESNTVPVGPSGKALSELTPSAREQLRTRLRERLPIAADGSIAYEAFANAVKGIVP